MTIMVVVMMNGSKETVVGNTNMSSKIQRPHRSLSLREVQKYRNQNILFQKSHVLQQEIAYSNETAISRNVILPPDC